MKITSIGKNKDKWVEESCNHYLTLLKKYVQSELKIIPALKQSSSLTPSEIKKREAPLIEKEFINGKNIALVDTGKIHDSISFSQVIQTWHNSGYNQFNFIIGGAYGLDKSILDLVEYQLSLSPLTMSHQLVRPVLLEQLFRAYSIINGSDYHK